MATGQIITPLNVLSLIQNRGRIVTAEKLHLSTTAQPI
jgi:hypothetical protein